MNDELGTDQAVQPQPTGEKINTHAAEQVLRLAELDPADAQTLRLASQGIRMRGAGILEDGRGFSNAFPGGRELGKSASGGVKSEMNTAERSRIFSEHAASWRRAA